MELHLVITFKFCIPTGCFVYFRKIPNQIGMTKSISLGNSFYRVGAFAMEFTSTESF